jgi:WD40 repeat protein/serine/threonine protein kinase
MSDEATILHLLEVALEPDGTPERACADRPDLLAEVTRRWQECRRLTDDLDAMFPTRRSAARNAGEPARSRAGHRDLPVIEGYQVESVLGQGGMGVVYRAVDLRLRRPVALKTLLAGAYASRSELTRFLREARAIASLRHPHVVHVYDAGEHDGRPYFTMELVAGGSLADRLAGVPMPPTHAAALLELVAGAVEAAHVAGIVHRDLKPGNVLLAVDGTPKVSDFGLAVRSGATAEEGLTLTGQRIGTPSYMAPEQASPRWGPVGPAADVYALGAILYEALTGRPPFRGDSAAETERQLISEEPVAPSRVNAQVPRDLETICLKCLQKDPPRRYASAADFAADLRRFLRNEPIHATPISRAQQTVRWMKRHRGLASALSGVAVLLVLLTTISLVASVHFSRLERQQRALAEENATIAAEKEEQRRKAIHAEREEATLRERAEEEGRKLRQNLYFNQMNLGAQAAISRMGIGRVGEWLKPWGVGEPDLRNWEWYYLNGLCHREQARLATVSANMHVAWSPDGLRLATAGTDGTVSIWDVATWREIRRFDAHAQREVDAVAWAPDGLRLASAGRDGTVKIWLVETGQAITTFRGHPVEVNAAMWSPDGKQVASVDGRGTILVWEPQSGAVRQELRDGSQNVLDVAWSPDGTRLASTTTEVDVCIWDLASSKLTLRMAGHKNVVRRVAWSPDGTRLASASNDHTVKIWNASTGAETATFRGHVMRVQSIAWSPDGTRLASGSEDHTVNVWPANGGSDVAPLPLRGHTEQVMAVAWSPDGSRIASASLDETVRLWHADASPEVPLLSGHTEPVAALAWAPDDGTRLASASWDKAVKVWDLASVSAEPLTLREHTASARAVGWSKDGIRIATAGSDHKIHLYNASDGRLIRSLHIDAETVSELAWSDDGRRLASASSDGLVRIWDPEDGSASQYMQGHSGMASSVTWSPDGTRLASGSFDRTVRVWDVSTGRPILSMTGHGSEVNRVAWSPDGRRIASASNDQTIRLWDARTGQPQMVLRGHTTRVTCVAWAPNGTRLASCSSDHTIKLWDATTGRETMTLECGGSMVNAIAWRPDGLALASAGDDHKVRIHDATPGYVEARSPGYLPTLDRRLAANPDDAAALQVRAEINARRDNWAASATDAGRILALQPQRRWAELGYWVVGPYPSDWDVAYAPEDDPEPSRPVRAADPSATLNWQPVPLDANGYVNLGARFGRADNISAYALIRIYSPHRQNVAVLVGSDDGVRVWLNGQQIHEARQERKAVPETDAVPATLVAGWNTLLARVTNATGNHGLYLRASAEPSDLARANTADLP